MKRETRIGLRVVISLILLFWLLRQIELHEFTQIAQSIRPAWAGITLAILVLGVFWSAWKWRILAACQIESPPKYLRWVRWYFVGSFSNLFFPTAVGGDAVRVALLRRTCGSWLQAASSVFMERLTGLTALILIAVVASGWLPIPGELSFLLPVYLLGLGFILGILFWLLKHPGEEEGANEQKTKPAGRIREELKRWAIHFARYRNHRGSLFVALLMSFVFQLQVIATAYLVSRSLGGDLKWSVCFLCVPLATLITMLPISINGIGVRESAYLFLLGQMGVPKAEAFLIGLGTFLFVLIVNSIGGLIAFNVGNKEEGITFKEPEAG